MTSAFGGDMSSEDVEGGNVRCRVEASSEESDGLDGMVGESGREGMGRGDGAALSGAAVGAVGTFVGAGGEGGEAAGATCIRGFVAVEMSSTGLAGLDGPPGGFDVDSGEGGVCGISAVSRGTPVADVEEESGATEV
ncbi:MAG: hypothetical protein NNA21_00135 [Nitrospira sp.]|nr:hypothetical protein [Nitrospira sp.]MCP9460801.1 hypothetical protein [Nitrospira sp.]